jgi:hypothetical protein
MTILRLPGADGLSAATRLASEDDISVANGFLAVTVRPWHVLMHAGREVSTRSRYSVCFTDQGGERWRSCRI